MAKANSNSFDVRVNVPTPLAIAAAGMAPGSWATFNCNYSTGTLGALLDVGGGKRCCEYSDKMVWDANRRKIYFTGGGHGQAVKTIVYDDTTNTWTDLGQPSWWTPSPSSACHAYQHNAFDGVDTHYFTKGQSSTSFKRNADSGNTWTAFAHGLSFSSDGLIGSCEYFPTMGTTGSLVFIDPGGCYRWDLTNNSGTGLGTFTMGDFHNVGVYSPGKDLLYFGGGNGSSQLYTMSSGRSVTPRSAPVAFGTNQSITTVDPASGKLVLVCADKVVRVYDPTTDTWTTDTAPPAGFWTETLYTQGPLMGIIAAPIYQYGVTMFITIQGPTVYLRRGR